MKHASSLRKGVQTSKRKTRGIEVLAGWQRVAIQLEPERQHLFKVMATWNNNNN